MGDGDLLHIMDTHLSMFNFICQIFIYFNILFKSCCKIQWSSGDLITLYSTQSHQQKDIHKS